MRRAPTRCASRAPRRNPTATVAVRLAASPTQKRSDCALRDRPGSNAVARTLAPSRNATALASVCVGPGSAARAPDSAVRCTADAGGGGAVVTVVTMTPPHATGGLSVGCWFGRSELQWDALATGRPSAPAFRVRRGRRWGPVPLGPIGREADSRSAGGVRRHTPFERSCATHVRRNEARAYWRLRYRVHSRKLRIHPRTGRDQQSQEARGAPLQRDPRSHDSTLAAGLRPAA